jgi:D-alanyl-D-alanine carboxypeptidase (penicillin-binding protein 5/6)
MTVSGRRLLASFCAILAVGGGVTALPAVAQAQIPYSSLNAYEPTYAAIVVDANTGEVLYAKNADAQRYPASITKVMTLYLAFEAISSGQLSLDDTLVVSPRAAAQSPTKLGLRAGESIRVEDAMHAIAVKSANDMAVALAEKIGGTESKFAALMTLRARELGMNNTRFVNASGLPDSRQLSSARDIAILSRAVMRDYPQYYGYFSQRNFSYRGQQIKNHNRLMFQMPGVDGIKTGFTNASGFNLAASAVRNNRRLIAVMLGGNSAAARDNHVQDLLETGFDVIRRRQRGEVITVAQSMFEPAPVGPLQRPSVEQGDTEQVAPVRATSTPRQAQAAVLAKPKAEKAAKAEKSDKTAKGSKSDGDYQVQVGAFRQKGLARTELKRVAKKYSDHLAGMNTEVVSTSSGEYRARFVGLSHADAKAACSKLKAAGQVCVVIAP